MMIFLVIFLLMNTSHITATEKKSPEPNMWGSMLCQLAIRKSVQAAHKEKDKASESTCAKPFFCVYMLCYVQIDKPQKFTDKNALSFLSVPKFMR